MTTYRTGNHWGVTIVREGEARCCDLHTTHCEAPADLCCHSCTEAAHTGLTPHADGSRCVLAGNDAQLVAVVVNGDQALAERICELLNEHGTEAREPFAAKRDWQTDNNPQLAEWLRIHAAGGA